jgi:hypothetical protein
MLPDIFHNVTATRAGILDSLNATSFSATTFTACDLVITRIT